VIAGVVLAAGEGRRFGGAKQLALLDGAPLIEHALVAMREADSIDRIIVVLGARADAIRAGADLEGADVIVADDWREGMSASLRAAIAAADGADAAMIALADQPLISSQAFAAVLGVAASGAVAARATYAGQPGHPVLIRSALFDEVAQLRGDGGARELLERAGVRTVECGRLGRPDDVDTAADLELIEARGRTRSEVSG
jgi:CTP:molybdopterin cytidylyltransferase MocA